MVKIYVRRFLRTCTLIICSLTNLVNRYIKSYIKILIKDLDEEHGPVKIVHRSENFLVVNKPYDMYINSDNPDRKVSSLVCEA